MNDFACLLSLEFFYFSVYLAWAMSIYRSQFKYSFQDIMMVYGFGNAVHIQKNTICFTVNQYLFVNIFRFFLLNLFLGNILLVSLTYIYYLHLKYLQSSNSQEILKQITVMNAVRKKMMIRSRRISIWNGESEFASE